MARAAKLTASNTLLGARLRARRKELGLSQAAVGEMLGVTFQQIQKYENGINRISAASLYELSKRLATPIDYFFKLAAEPKSAARKSRAP